MLRWRQGEGRKACRRRHDRHPQRPPAWKGVNAEKYQAARKVFLGLLPARAPGLTQTEMMKAMRKALPGGQFPGTTTSWWMKTVQLDAEAHGEVVRDGAKPLRWRKVK